ncbi:GIY-YIG nuclease family protein, partial [Salmonella enterica subsp. enterica]|nr:GIY-YIG nuclease family protein [Salmonella enterica subsp. enterica]
MAVSVSIFILAYTGNLKIIMLMATMT